MKRKRLLLIPALLLIFAAISIPIFAQTGDTDFKDALVELGLKNWIVDAVLGLVGAILLQLAIPEKFASILYILEAGLHWVNQHTNRLSAKQKARKEYIDKALEEGIAKAKRFVPAILLFFIVSFSASAQSPFNGFFKPVKTNPAIQDKVMRDDGGTEFKSTAWLFRPAVALTATSVNFRGGTAETKFMSSIGTGVSFAKYVNVDDEPYAQVSVNALFLTSITIDEVQVTGVGGALTVGLFNNLLSMGGGYQDKGFVLLLGAQLSF